jgi:phage terminase large subunit
VPTTVDLRPVLRPYQTPAWEAWERDGLKRLLLIWHRRAGKDELALRMGAVAAAKKPANYWHCLPLYEQARKAIWEAVNPHSGRRRIDEAFPPEIRKRTDNGSMTIELWNGSIWRVVGSDNPDSLVGAPPAGIVFSEWALANPSAWAYLAPILLENNGWAIFITTPRGRNHVKTMLDMAQQSPQWFTQILTPTETGFPIEKVEEQRAEYHSIFGQDAGDALIEQEYWCSFEAAVLGAYWGKEMVKAEKEGRICDVPFDPDMPVQTAWDLGVGDSTAIWFFQTLRGGIHVIDFYEASGYGADHYAEMLDKRRDERGYRYGKHWIPHDGRVKEWGSGKTRVETLLSLGYRPDVVPLSGLDDGINAARQILPQCRFDKTRTADGLERLRAYKRKWDDDKKVFSNTPLHDWTSHAADAFRYLAMAHRELKPEPAIAPPPRPSMAASVQDMLRRQEQRDRQRARL